jgi:hypothetical protein
MSATITYRKTKAGEWVAFGPAAIVRPGFVTITKRSGESKTELVDRVGRTFTVNGAEMVYGYLAKTPAPRTASTSTGTVGRGGICDECLEPRRNLRPCSDSSGLVGMCCPRCAAAPSYTRSFA